MLVVPIVRPSLKLTRATSPRRGQHRSPSTASAFAAFAGAWRASAAILRPCRRPLLLQRRAQREHAQQTRPREQSEALVYPTRISEVTPHPTSNGRFELAIVPDPTFPDFPDCQLSIVVRAGDFAPGDRGFLVVVGAQVPEDLSKASGWDGLLAESGYVVKPTFFGRRYLSNGLLLQSSVVQDFVCEDALPDSLLDPGHLTKALRVEGPPTPFRSQSFLLEVGFDGSGYYGSQSTGSEEARPTVLGQVMQSADRLGWVSGQDPRTSRSHWVCLSRVDAGVSARSFLLTTPPLINPLTQTLPSPEETARALSQELPSNIQVHRAVLKPRGEEIHHTQDISREYGYFFPLDLLQGNINGLQEILQDFVGDLCFANFTELKKLEGLKKKIQRSLQLQSWAHGLQSWKRSRRDANYSTSSTSTLRVHHAMQAACARTITRLNVEKVPDTKLACICVQGNGFLYNMVRYIAGSALSVHSGRLSASTLQTALSALVAVDLSEHLAPARGLVLLRQNAPAGWISQDALQAEISADRFMKQQLLPAIEEAWNSEASRGWASGG